MIAIIGGQTRSFRPLIDLYRKAWRKGESHSPDDFDNHQVKVGVHSRGYVAYSTKEAIDDFFPGYAHTMTKLGKEIGWHKVTRSSF